PELAGELRDHQGYEAHERQAIDEVDPPALGVRVASVHKLAELGGHIGPAGTCPFAGAGGAIGTPEYGPRQPPFDDPRRGVIDDSEADERQERVRPGGEEVGAEPADRTDG